MKDAEINLARKLFGVFEMLKNSNEFPNSGTSKMLREKDARFFRTRADDEFRELVGVVDGCHRHSDDFEKDFVLESSQVFYWLALAAVVQKKSFAEFEKMFDPEISRLEKLHAENKIPIAKVFEKDLRECEEKGYLQYLE
ncbi:hypothetical protein KKF38_02320 [Patescibacteria group bacterium]|nr:hypothetical protein [Patescibacteria group bacterium]